MDLPGVEPDATAVNLRGRRLSVSARREADGISCKVHRMERINGQLHRAVKLPCTVNSSVIDTQYKDGVLKISIAKKDKGVSHSCCPPEEQDW